MASRRSARLSALVSSTVLADALPPSALPAVRKRKAPAKDPAPPPAPAEEEAPSTPPRRRARKNNQELPATPTPNAVGLMAEKTQVNRSTPVKKPKSAAISRLADPNKTNAPLFSPKTSRIVASRPADAASPSKAPTGSSKAPRTTTENILEEACAHLIKVDERMRSLIENHHCRLFSSEGLSEEIDPFEALASGIISQQVSGAAAKAIKGRFVALFSDGSEVPQEIMSTGSSSSGRRRFPHPSQVAPTPLETLRTAGLSQRKAEYIIGLAEKFDSGELSAQMLADAPYEEIVEKLIAVRGLGRWSVEMFACFGLKRMDVFSLGDLGVQRGMAAFVRRDIAKLKAKGGKWKYMSEKEMEEISDRFKPYRSLFMWYMWRVEETDVSTME
ncbi:DNA glycosylase [Lasiosphaeria miniovina]|uniref:DNA glycosylase n=1 Tax=Lasiosphaeria miniovina TaxID=1954250 RepID=A0AA40B3H5_9PEZI|nr:DNA glycosylase [Lasiosphaeria miniovina]KAK0727000.1 DNA glycosylase [Lasiosphaeria miniovina]